VLPFERLRYLARHSGDDRVLALEAADCLADFDGDPQLVTVCRRLLAHHAVCGPLWWVCARVLAAPDAGTAARECSRLIEGDRTGARLASVLPFPHDETVAVVGWPDATGAAIVERPDLDAVAIRVTGDRAMSLRGARRDPGIRVVDQTEAMAVAPSHVLVQARAASATTALVPAGTADLVWALGSTEWWLVVPVGRLLPDRLFAVLSEQATGAADVEPFDVARVSQVAGPAGLDLPARLASRLDCPVAPELLRI
jgi:hypothetical protein